MDFGEFEQCANSTISKLKPLSEFAGTITAEDTTKHSFLIVKYNRSRGIYNDYQSKANQMKKFTDEQFRQFDILDSEINDLVDFIESVHLDVIRWREVKPSVVDSKADNYSNIQLPLLKLNTFDGTNEAWTPFFELFTTLVGDHPRLSKLEKLQYLRMSLTGEALDLVKHLPIIGENYEIALDTLQKRFENKRLLMSTHWGNICNFENIVQQSPKSLRSLLNTFAENISALKKYKADLWDFTLFNWLLQKVDPKTKERFEMHHSGSDVPKYEELYEFLLKQCKAMETNLATSSVISPNLTKPFSRKFTSRPQAYLTNTPNLESNTSEIPSNKSVMPCFVCHGLHNIMKCELFVKKSPQERYALVKEHRRCINCMGSHLVAHCKSNSTCRECRQQHHTMLHFPKVYVSSTSEQSPVTVTGISTPATVLLSTALVSVCDSKGNFQICRSLLDSGSQICIISEKCVDRLGLFSSPCSMSVHGIGRSTAPTSRLTSCQITPLHKSSPKFIVEAVVLPTVCDHLPTSTMPHKTFPHTRNLLLADPDFWKSGEIDILLSADIFSKIIQPGLRYGRPGEPTAIKTAFGWVLSGKVKTAKHVAPQSLHASLDSQTDEYLKKFWELESVPTTSVSSPEENKCEQTFQDTHVRDSSGRYTVSLPFKTFLPDLGNSYPTAKTRFLRLENRLNKDESLREEYSAFIQDYIDSKHMSLVTMRTESAKYYIPHHCVFKPDSTTTKLRVVFDASAKTENGLSLNDTLLTGPKLQQNIVKLLLKFRFHAVVLTADIKQMYRQIFVSQDHTKYQHILWRFHTSMPIQEYKLNTVTYGVSSAPFLAIRTLLQLASDEKNNFPVASKILATDTYVDDLVTGCASDNGAVSLYHEMVRLLQSGGFMLRKWCSNSSVVLQNIPQSLRQTNCQTFDTADSFSKVLGLIWNPKSDIFTYQIDMISSPCTKRNILSEIARIFDPLGLLSPLTLFAKHLIQILWTQGLSWDDTPCSDICTRWSQYKSELPCLSEVEIPRRLITDSYNSCQLHGFCDASEIGYAAVIYLRITHTDTAVENFIVCGKAKVAPLKSVTIPRLELCAALLLSELVSFVLETYAGYIKIDEIYAWSDSSVALTWIKSSPHQWKTFISNRVAQIQENISPQNWHHISGTDNPADCASRGLLPNELLTHPTWWTGPSWLNSPTECWPLNTNPQPPSDVDMEHKTLSLVGTQPVNFIPHLLNRFSSLRKVQGSIAYFTRFLSYLKSKTIVSAPLVQAELHAALMVIIKHTQSDVFGKEIKQIQNKLPCSKTLRKLAPFLDDSGILRVGGRLRNSSEPFEVKHPILLPRNHRLTVLLIQQYHLKHLHPGAATLQAILAQQFWILAAKRAINHCITNCFRCSRYIARSYAPIMSDLPRPRVSEVKPFLHTGVDYAGPFTISFGRRRGGATQKAYLCLFVCLATKALHLELVSSLSSDAFIAALRRFVARRGQCCHLYSDNGTNFVGANHQLITLVEQAAGVMEIKWHFIPPSSPHFGGLWEANIRSVKHHLKRVVGDQVLTYEELITVLHQIEAILNSRPLSPLSNDPNDLQPLTPGHFLLLAPCASVPDEDFLSISLNRLSRWQLLQQLQQSFWHRWHKEYLHTLHQRHKWNDQTNPPSVGTMVIIKDDNAPPLQWRLGRIENLHAGPDGQIRVATVRTASGSLTRPLVKLCPLFSDT